MKKFIIAVAAVILAVFAWDYAYYRLGWYIDLHPDKKVTTWMKTDETMIYKKDAGSGKYEPFEVRGINMGSGTPGEWATDYAIDKETYMKWFAQMQEMGANTLRIYTIQADDFYNAFYEYNEDREEPLYLIHGVWVNDYVQNSHRDAYDDEFREQFLTDCRTMVDTVHGNKKIAMGRNASAGSGTYNKDISPWVIGYILGVEWEDVTVAYTDDKYRDETEYNSYQGKYMYASEDATPFECMLAEAGDKIIEYESERYKEQRLIAFANWPTTDPFTYSEKVTKFFMKCAFVDVEHIKTTDAFLSGQFASYHVYPYYPDYLNYEWDWSAHDISRQDFISDEGTLNSYLAYLYLLNRHHNMPVLITEFGVSTGRGMAQEDQNTGRNQGNMSEKEQGQALIECWEDILTSGSAGGCIFSWQDEWFKRTWNTMYAVDLKRTPYWSDYQTNEQYFGLLSFDPGKEKSVCYVDGDVREWTEEDVVSRNEDMVLSIKYDEKFVYFRVNKKDVGKMEDVLYIPIDTTPKSGSTYCRNYDIKFDCAADFLIVIDGKENSRVQVQERYEALRSTYSQNLNIFDTYEKAYQPDVDSPLFVNINMILQISEKMMEDVLSVAESFETGLLTYGNANPESKDFNSLADFICEGDYIEIKIPWQLFNFSDPSKMEVHDDYYDDNYGVDYINIDNMQVGIACETDEQKGRIHMTSFSLKGWENKVTSHERLKSSYYIMKEYWGGETAD